MCEYCHRIPHHPRCPDAPPPPVYAHCQKCKTEIYDGDEYYKIDEKNYCEACVKEGYRTAEVNYYED